MFSRSEKTEEVIDPMAEPAGQRSPMVLAALAGLLAIAGAFLLVWYLNTGQDEVATSGSSGEVTSAPDETNQQVLVVVETIPRGTSVSELIEAPTVYLSARAVPEQFVAASAITSVAGVGSAKRPGEDGKKPTRSGQTSSTRPLRRFSRRNRRLPGAAPVSHRPARL